jgi:TRAP-type transport system periplasmic protein
MSEPLQVRLGGYAPKDSTHGSSLDVIAARLKESLGDGVEVEIDYNILDRGLPVQDLLGEVKRGEKTLCFFSSSYLADRVPELGIVDLPYVFDSLDDAHRRLDGALGAALSAATRKATGFVPLGYWDNGFRHLSNSRRDVRTPEDCRGLKIRLQPNWAHEALFAALGCEPVLTDLRDGIAKLTSGELDAQENPLANLVAYGVHEVHKHLSMTRHVYGARGLYASEVQLRTWPDHAVEALQAAVDAAIAHQREAAEAKELELRRWLEDEQGLTILDLTDDEHAAFRAVADPVLAQARPQFSDELWAHLTA